MNEQTLYACVDTKQNFMIAKSSGMVYVLPSLIIGDKQTMEDISKHIGILLPIIPIDKLPKHFADLRRLEVHSLEEYIKL